MAYFFENKKSMIACFILLFIILMIIGFFSIPLKEVNVEKETKLISILFLGDFMIGDSYQGQNDAPFNQISSMFEQKDEIIINLETAVTDSVSPINSEKNYVYKMDSIVIDEVISHNITMANLANNHIMDYGKNGLNDTLLHLNTAKITHFGAGTNLLQARNGTIKQYGSVTIGYLGYFEYRSSYDTIYQFYAKQNSPGVANINKTYLQSDISRMKNDTDIVIVSLHISSNYETKISNFHQEIARYAIDCGADAVICHSTHIVLPFEFYKDKPIFYSIGNFIFTTPGRFRYVDEVYHAGMGVNLIIKKQKISSIELIPFKTDNQETNYKPSFLDQNETSTLFNTIFPINIDATLYESYACINCP